MIPAGGIWKYPIVASLRFVLGLFGFEERHCCGEFGERGSQMVEEVFVMDDVVESQVELIFVGELLGMVEGLRWNDFGRAQVVRVPKVLKQWLSGEFSVFE